MEGQSQLPVQTRLWWQRRLILFLAVVLAATFAVNAVRGLGRWLIVEDPLKPARAIVVLGGGFPFRAMEAASIYKQGWAPEVWLTRPLAPAEEAALARLGLHLEGEETSNQLVLERLGVPSDAIRLLGGGAQNTVDEVRRVASELREIDGDRLILVTSKPHSRRVRAIWRAVVRRPFHAAVRYPVDDPYDPGHWWRHTSDALAVSREIFGLMNVWAGFPLQPDGR